MALLDIQATPIDAVLPSPAELMLGQELATTLPSRKSHMAMEGYREHTKELSNKQKACANQQHLW